MKAREFNGERCREIREQRKLTQPELAALISADDEFGGSVTKWAVSKWEAGVRSPSPKRFGALCRALRVDEEVLLISRAARAA